MNESTSKKAIKQASASDPDIRHKLIESLYLNSGSTLAGSILAVVILTAIFSRHVPPVMLASWGIYMLLVTLVRYGLLHQYKTGASSATALNQWAVYFYMGSAMNGLGWGAATWALFTADALYQAILYITLAGIMAAGVVALATRHVAVACFLAPITLLGILRLVTTGETTHLALAAMLSVFSVFLFRFAKMSEHTQIDSLRLRYENQNLLGHLESSNRKLTETNQKYIQLNAELTKMRDEALDLARAKSEFLATMSHEIRTPMNGVLGMIELLLGTRLSAQQKRFAETVRRSGETLLTIINNILDFSKIEAGKMTIEQSPFNLRDLIEDLGELFSIRAHSKGLELACSVPADIPEAMSGDTTRLRQVLTNLVGNAIKFTESGEVLISIHALRETETTACIRFAIRDTGIGLDSSQAEQVFEPFAQGDGSTTRKYGGTGLGLAISRQLVELMGGQLGIDSTPGQGSTFFFELELEKQQVPRDTASGGSSHDFSRLQVLVVDDNATNREILSNHLDTWGITHDCIESGASALLELHAATSTGKPYNMVILDYHMPGMDGLELARIIHSDPQLSSVRMAIFSSADNVLSPSDYLDIGIDYSATKPVRQSELYDCLANRNGLFRNDIDAVCPQDCPTRHHEPSAMRILVVEDNEVNLAVAIGMLNRLGYEDVHSANNGREALDSAENTDYDLILMDMQMPVMDGYEATSALREREQTLTGSACDTSINPVPIIALTANAMEGDRERCLEAGANDYLSKPFTPGDLCNLLDKWLPQTGTREVMADTETAQETEYDAPRSARHENNAQPAPVPSSPIDQGVLDIIRDMEDEDDPDMLAEILGLYIDKSPGLLQSMQAAIASKDADSLRVAAHTLKSSSANVGARDLADLCRELEELGRNGTLDTAATRFSVLHQEYRRVAEALSDEIKRNAA